MTLDEAIKHCEEVAEEQDKLCKRYDDASGYSRSHNEDIRTTGAIGCEVCAKEHRQLAGWLKELKALKEQQPCDDAISRQAVLEQINCWIGSGEYRYTNATDYLTRRMQGIPPVKPQYTEAEIQKMQELEQAEIQKAYELWKAQEPCEDAISRQAVEKITWEEPSYTDALNILTEVRDKIRALPPVTPQQRMGRWIDDKCSVCGKGIDDLIDSYEWYRNESPKYCPFCGIKIQPYKAESEVQDGDSN